MDEVRTGNEDVVRARFADAAYFFRHDVSKPLESYLPRLDTITFQAKLGSMLDKARRIERLVEPIGIARRERQRQSPAASRHARYRPARRPPVQGRPGHQHGGGDHRAAGRDGPRVLSAPASRPRARATWRWPRPSSSTTCRATPATRRRTTLPGLIVGLADKLDSIAGLFAVGLAPKGSADPFALRRAAIGVVQNLVAAQALVLAAQGLAAGVVAAAGQDQPRRAGRRAHVHRRAPAAQLLDDGYRYDVVDAVLAAQGDNPYRARLNVGAAGEWVEADGWDKLLAAYSRSARIIKSAGWTTDPSASSGQADGRRTTADIDPNLRRRCWRQSNRCRRGRITMSMS